MAKFTDEKGLIPTPAGAAPQGDNIVAQIKDVASNIKELIQMFQAMRQVKAQTGQSEAGTRQPGITKENVIRYLEAVCSSGMADTTVGQLLTQLGPVKLSQILEFLKK